MNFEIKNSNKPLVIMELANNHMGNVIHAKKIINNFSKITKKYESKIDFALKFQYRNSDTFINTKFKNTDHKGVKRFESTFLKEKQWKDIFIFSKKKFKLICTPFDESSVSRVVKEKFDFLKIASCSITDWPLMEYIVKKAKTKKIICSLGGASEREISNVVSFLSSRIKKVNFLYCVAMYPTKPENLNLAFFSYLKNLYGSQIKGFSSHEEPDEFLSGAISYGLGARIFEKHIAVKTKKYSPNDYSVKPEQFDKWLKFLEKSIDRMGDIKSRSSNIKYEKRKLNEFKRGVYLKNSVNLKKNSEIKNEDLLFQFPAIEGQLLANDLSKFSIYKTKKNITGQSPILKKNLIYKDKRIKITNIRDKIRDMIFKSKIIVPNQSEIEVSHHYGLESFDKFGLSMITIFNKGYCKKLLFLINKQTHPKQFHKEKNETFFILYGKIRLKIWYKNNKLIDQVMKAGDIFTIKPNHIHWFKSVSKGGSIVEELSTESKKKDSYYLDKKISENKNRKSFIKLN